MESRAGEPAKGRKKQKCAMVKTLEQECQGSNPACASSKVYDLGKVHIPLCLSFPLCEMGDNTYL